jgi:hypothetical protein
MNATPSSRRNSQPESPAPLLQFNWEDARQFDQGFDFLSHSDDVNVQLQRLMGMSFSPLESAASPISRQTLAGSDLSVRTPSTPRSSLWRQLDKERWDAQIDQVKDIDQVLSWRF